MKFWDENFLNKRRKEWLNSISKIQYYDGKSWHDAVMTEKKIEGNTLKILSVTTDNANLTITRVRLLDTGGNIAGQISESIKKLSTQGVITLWEFPLYEIENTD